MLTGRESTETTQTQGSSIFFSIKRQYICGYDCKSDTGVDETLQHALEPDVTSLKNPVTDSIPTPLFHQNILSRTGTAKRLRPESTAPQRCGVTVDASRAAGPTHTRWKASTSNERRAADNIQKPISNNHKMLGLSWTALIMREALEVFEMLQRTEIDFNAYDNDGQRNHDHHETGSS